MFHLAGTLPVDGACLNWAVVNLASAIQWSLHPNRRTPDVVRVNLCWEHKLSCDAKQKRKLAGGSRPGMRWGTR
jgi:hypothetical protein